MRLFAVLATALGLFALGGAAPANAGPVEVIPASGSVSITTVLGSETIALSGTVTVGQGAQYMDGDRPAIDTEIVAVNLSGMSVTGPVSVAESPTLASTGQFRALFSGFDLYPATGSFDVYLRVTVPASPSPTMTLHNKSALEIAASGLIFSWPSTTTFAGTPSPCLPFLPVEPLHMCLDDVSIALNYQAVGGVAEAPAVRERPGRDRPRDDDAGAGADVAAGLLVAAVAVGGAWFAHKRRAR